MTDQILFDPLLPLPILLVLALLVLGSSIFALLRGLGGWALRGLGGLVLIAALAQPVWQREERSSMSDIVLMLVDKTASQRLSTREARTEAAAAKLEQLVGSHDATELRRIDVRDGDDDTGTRMITALSRALAEEPRARIAGIILLSDGQTHDAEALPNLPAPMHLLHTGISGDWDRRLSVSNAPAFAILGEEVKLTVRIDDMGAAPETAGRVALDVSVDGERPIQLEVPLGQDVRLPVTLPHSGRNVLRFSTPGAAGELTDRNNSAIVQINAVRDRLRVLLVSGQPHPGGRTWRNLLKSDSSVDLVHFTILRPPDKQDGVPVSELSLIPFPTRELFLEKIDDFDLIIFDRYKRRGLLPANYLDNVRQYVERGGAVLISAGPDFAGADSLYRTPLQDILPAMPTARVIEEGYRPTTTDIGNRHPVTAALPGRGEWGRWLRQVDVMPVSGHTLMIGHDERPLLVLDRVGEGRVALLASDHAWLWSRGFEGGGPQLELLRRMAHWLMKEPELEEEALWAEAQGQSMRIVRQTLDESVGQITITNPDGSRSTVELGETGHGRFEADFTGPEIGLYRISDDRRQAVIGLGPAAPREFVNTLASEKILGPAVASSQGGIHALSDGVPGIRKVRAERPATGRGWIGITPRGAYVTTNVSRQPLLPGWLALVLAAGAIIGGWLREGRS